MLVQACGEEVGQQFFKPVKFSKPLQLAMWNNHSFGANVIWHFEGF
jgi:hypothetical protein